MRKHSMAHSYTYRLAVSIDSKYLHTHAGQPVTYINQCSFTAAASTTLCTDIVHKSALLLTINQ